jgi:hypothetical protein
MKNEKNKNLILKILKKKLGYLSRKIKFLFLTSLY